MVDQETGIDFDRFKAIVIRKIFCFYLKFLQMDGILQILGFEMKRQKNTNNNQEINGVFVQGTNV